MGLAGAEGGQLDDINEIFPFAGQVGCHQEGEERDQHWGGWGVQGSILWDSISPHLAPPVLVSLSPVGSWAISPLLLLCFCIFNIKGCCWLGAWGGGGKQAPGGLDSEVPWGRTASPRGRLVPSACGAFSVLGGPSGTGRAAL